MTDAKYPLCEKLGLKIRHAFDLGVKWISARELENVKWINARELENLLSSAPVVYQRQPVSDLVWYGKKEGSDTHSARLICIEEIKQESEEIKLMREFLRVHEEIEIHPQFKSILANVKAFLDRKDAGRE